MAFGTGTFGGFGANTNQQQGSSPFGGFGGGGTTGGFGSTSTSSPFGTTGTTGGGFGSSGGSAFGTGGGFGSGSNTQTGSLFGNQNRTTGFGSGGTGSTLFGGGSGSTPAFGQSGFGTGGTGAFGSTGTSQAGGGLFGGSGTTAFGSGLGSGTSAFGSNTAGASPFGGTTSTPFGGVPPPEGTANPPFSPYTEKDSAASSTTNHFQNICAMQPYQKYSPEELRVADYNHGRRFGNASGQPGAFGASAFGGFGQTGTGFGSTSSSTPFGTTSTSAPAFGGTTQSTGFGSTSTSNPLFGAQKPATSLFGQQTTGTSQPSAFGTSGGTGAFGSGTSAFGNTGGGLFGSNNQQNKPFGGFGSGSAFGQTTTTSASPFGTTTSTASPFGQQQQTGTTSAFGGFGQNQQQQGTGTTSLFGNTGNQQSGSSGGGLFGGGGTTGSSLFGNQQQQQGTGSSLFGNLGTQQSGTTGGGLFGGGQQQQQQKPLFGGLGSGTTTGTSAFGGFGTQNQGTSGTTSLFGNQQNQQQQQQQQQQKPSLFGSSTTGQTGSLFGGGTTSTTGTGTGGGLFSLGGNQGTQQQNTGTSFGTGSLFGSSQQQQPQQQQAQQQQPLQPPRLQASLLEGNPYGSQSIFSDIPPANLPSPGPLATPLSASQKQKQRTPLPIYKISPNAANRLITPPPRQGFGFSYSTYGSPSSVSTTPLGGSLRGSLGRSFSKSLSATSSLRRSFDPETESILAPGAFSPGASKYSPANLKKLTIDRSVKTDSIFTKSQAAPRAITNGEDAAGTTGSKLKKKVSFDESVNGEKEDENAGAVVRVEENESPEQTPEKLGFLRSPKNKKGVNGTAVVNGAKEGDGPSKESSVTEPGQPEMEQTSKGKELVVVPDEAPRSPPYAHNENMVNVPLHDPKPGDYWMKPSREEIAKMTRTQQKNVVGFKVGRTSCGHVSFDEPVDLTSVDLDNLFGNIVVITLRSITVYPDGTDKPPVGKGLNVPSTLRIENSWPRRRDKKTISPFTVGPLFEKHVERLRRISGTEFVSYEKNTGVWTFKVPHFTTYGFDYEDDENEGIHDDGEGESFDQSTLSALPDSTPKATAQDQTPGLFNSSLLGNSVNSNFSLDESFDDSMSGVEDDTFDFKKRNLVPGAFGVGQGEKTVDNNEQEEDGSFLDDGSAGSGSGSNGSGDAEEGEGEEEEEEEEEGESYDSQDGSDVSARSEELESDQDEIDMAGSFPTPGRTAEPVKFAAKNVFDDNAYSRSRYRYESPSRDKTLNLSGNWAQQLQRTISPRKQDRQALRELQENAFANRTLFDQSVSAAKSTSSTTRDVQQQPGFVTSIDLMNSLFRRPGQPSPMKKKPELKEKGSFEWPYPKKPKTFANAEKVMSENDVKFHNSFKPRWTGFDRLVFVVDTFPSHADSDMMSDAGTTATAIEQRTLMYSQVDNDTEVLTSQSSLLIQKQRAEIRLVDNVPFARLNKADFRRLSGAVQGNDDMATLEKDLWNLTFILFTDDIQDDISAGVPENLQEKYRHRIKKDRLSRLLENMIRTRHATDITRITVPEERAIAYLCSHRVEEACKTLIEAGNPHLATLISQIGRDATTRADIAEQIKSWRSNNILSEMSEPIRALYELMAGNCVRSEGKPSGPLEDRASTFYISERFELDWIQAFGLRLWYAISDDDPLEKAVSLFHHDLCQENEPAYPIAWSEEDKELGRESPLWVVLKAYAVAASEGQHPEVEPIPIPEAIMPGVASESPVHNRLPFQLLHHLVAVTESKNALTINQDRADQLAWDFTWELATAEQYIPALFVVMHLHNAPQRERGIKEILSRAGSWLPPATNPDGTGPHPLWQILTEDLQIPSSWLWVAKAQYAHAHNDYAAEVNALVHAKHWNAAHEIFTHIVAPKAVIERDYPTLNALLSGFGEAPEKKIRGWANGGGIYEDFLHLAIDVTAGSHAGSRRDRDGYHVRLKRLVGALKSTGSTSSQSLDERIAFREISKHIAAWCAGFNGTGHRAADMVVEPAAILNLPLTPNARFAHAATMSRRYYETIMAGGS